MKYLNKRRHFLWALLGSGVAAKEAFAATPSAYPNRPVTIVVPFPAGATMDALVRTLAKGLSDRWQQTVVVDNRTGAGGVVGTSFVAKAAPDGYTLLAVANSFATNAILRKDLPYDAQKDFVPLNYLGAVPHVLVVNSQSKITDISQLKNIAKSAVPFLSYSSGGTATMSHIAGEMLSRAIDAQLLHVPYRGQAPALTDVASGQVSMNFANLPEALPLIKAGRVRALAIADGKRSSALPGVPTFAEVGMGSVDSKSWYGLVAPKGISPEIAETIKSSVAAVLANPATENQMREMGLDPGLEWRSNFDQYLGKTEQLYRQVITQSNIKLD